MRNYISFGCRVCATVCHLKETFTAYRQEKHPQSKTAIPARAKCEINRKLLISYRKQTKKKIK